MIRQCCIIFGCLALGELIVKLTHIPLPSSIIGMLLLALFLQLGWIKLAWVKGLSNLLIGNMGFFFIPPGVAVMLYFDLIKSEWLAITLSTIASIIVVMWITGWSYKATRIIQRRFKTYKKNGKHI